MATELHIASGSAATVEADAVVLGLMPAGHGDDGAGAAARPRRRRARRRLRRRSRRAAHRGRRHRQGRRGRQAAHPRRDRPPRCWSPSGWARPAPVPRSRPRRRDREPSRCAGPPGRRRGRWPAPATPSSTLAGSTSRAAAEGTLLGAYTFTAYRSGNGSGARSAGSTDLLTDDGDTRTRRRRCGTAVAVAEAVCTARDLVNTPPNDLFPETFAARAQELAAGSRARGGGARRRRARRGRLRRRARRRAGLARASRGWCGCAGRVGRPRGRRSRWSARASRSTPAASRSSPRRTWTT